MARDGCGRRRAALHIDRVVVGLNASSRGRGDPHKPSIWPPLPQHFEKASLAPSVVRGDVVGCRLFRRRCRMQAPKRSGWFNSDQNRPHIVYPHRTDGAPKIKTRAAAGAGAASGASEIGPSHKTVSNPEYRVLRWHEGERVVPVPVLTGSTDPTPSTGAGCRFPVAGRGGAHTGEIDDDDGSHGDGCVPAAAGVADWSVGSEA